MKQVIAYSVAGIGPFAIAATCIAYLESHRPGGEWNSNTTTALIAGAAAASTQLAILMKSIGNSQKIDHLHDCVEHRTEIVKQEAATAREAATATHAEVMKAIQNGGIPGKGKDGHLTVDGTIAVDGKEKTLGS